MSFTSRVNMTIEEPDVIQWPLTVGLSTLAAAFLGFLAFIAYTPAVHENSPQFTSYTSPFIGSFEFGTDPWKFWKKSTDESKTGNFSFWLGSRHVVGMTGEAARKMFFDHPQLTFVKGQIIRAMGVHFFPPVHDIFKPGFHTGRANTYFLRRLLELQKTEHLTRYLSRMLIDARIGLRALALAEGSNSVTDTSNSLWRTIFTQDCRLLCADEMADHPRLFQRSSDSARTLLHTFTHYNVHFPWLLTPTYLKRRYMRYKLWSTVKTIVEKRMDRNKPSMDDPAQALINNGDPKDHVIEFFTSTLFIAPAYSSIIAGRLLSLLAMRTDLQEKIYEEIRSVAEAHSTTDGGSSLVEQLKSIPLEAWESSFPTIGLCLEEAIRMWTSFSMVRLNESEKPIPIPGSDEVVPGNTFVCYNNTEVNFSEKLYPDANYFDPERFTEGREEFKKEAYGFVGWGQGRHSCAGMRWAKLQQNIIIAYSLAMYQWKTSDENGQVITDAVYKRPCELNSHQGTVFPSAFCKLVPRE